MSSSCHHARCNAPSIGGGSMDSSAAENAFPARTTQTDMMVLATTDAVDGRTRSLSMGHPGCGFN